MEKQGSQLSIKDLEAVRAIVETKVKELRLVDKSKKQTADQEHKQVLRVIGDLVQILLGYVGEASEAVPLFQNVFGPDVALHSTKKEETDPAKV